MSCPRNKLRPGFAAIFAFQISKRFQVGNPLCDHEMGFINLRITKNRGLG